MGRKLQDELEGLFKAAEASEEEKARAPGPPPHETSGSSAKKRKVPAASAPSGLPRASSGAGGSATPLVAPRGLSISRSHSVVPSRKDGLVPRTATERPPKDAPGPPKGDAMMTRSKPASPAKGGASFEPPKTTTPAKPEAQPRRQATAPSKESTAAPRAASSLAPPPKRGGTKAKADPSDKGSSARSGGSDIRDPRAFSLEDPVIDHKGRSKPLYKPRTPRPKTWKPSKATTFALGVFPGARIMATASFREGSMYTALALAVVVLFSFLAIGWSQTVGALRALQIDDRWILLHAGLIVGLVALFELLRLGSFLEERRVAARGSRVLASLFLPSCAVLLLAPELAATWPRFVEATWCAAAVLASGGLAGMVWCSGEGSLSTPLARTKFRVAGISFLALVVILGWMTGALGASHFREAAAVARGRGFAVVARALQRIGDLAP